MIVEREALVFINVWVDDLRAQKRFVVGTTSQLPVVLSLVLPFHKFASHGFKMRMYGWPSFFKYFLGLWKRFVAPWVVFVL